ncbi:VRR-NUC domain-containing protein [Spirosoma validum]|uniref:VRR-NUC domain-containing protein n=1 Tax=Spirosoma validum TaxID=2771355 RepID=A0A927GDK5_9BACT|nr:VRR-NUC domain-containing protein [Spirosoma validum]MBD2753819.1 VRR-NUC domain-containing protein [Spirosoma validum]
MSKNNMTAAEFQAFHKNVQKGLSTKKGRKAPQPNTITADEYRSENVDQEEHGLQARCVEWFRLQYPQYLIYAVPNAAKRSFALAAWLEDEGLVSGIPDLHVAVPTDTHPGLFIEMKVKDRKPSDKQAIIHAYLRGMGYAVEIPQTFEEFKLIVDVYLS